MPEEYSFRQIGGPGRLCLGSRLRSGNRRFFCALALTITLLCSTLALPVGSRLRFGRNPPPNNFGHGLGLGSRHAFLRLFGRFGKRPIGLRGPILEHGSRLAEKAREIMKEVMVTQRREELAGICQ